MWTVLKRQASVNIINWGIAPVAMIGSSVAGSIFLYVLIRVIDKEAVEVVPVGTLLAAVIGGIHLATMIIVGVNIYFNIEVAMGSTRKQFFISWFVFYAVGAALCGGLLICIAAAERGINQMLYPGMSQRINFVPYIQKWSVAAAVGIVIVATFVGTCLLRLGKIGRYILLAVWLFACVCGPQIVEAVTDAPDSVFGRIGRGFAAVVKIIPGNTWISISVLAGLACIAGTWLIVRTQRVKS